MATKKPTFKNVKGFKGFKLVKGKLECRGMKFTVGKSHRVVGAPVLCHTGIHYCDDLKNIHPHYSLTNVQNVFCEIEVLGPIETDGRKSATNHIKINRILSPKEIFVDRLKAKIVRKNFKAEVFLSAWDTDYSLKMTYAAGGYTKTLNSFYDPKWERVKIKENKITRKADQDGAKFSATVDLYKFALDGEAHFFVVVKSDLKHIPKPIPVYQNTTIKIK